MFLKIDQFLIDRFRIDLDAVDITFKDVSLVTDVAEALQGILQRSHIFFIQHVVDDQGIETIALFEFADPIEDRTAGHRLEGIGQFDPPVVFFIEFLHLGDLGSSGDLTVDA